LIFYFFKTDARGRIRTIETLFSISPPARHYPFTTSTESISWKLTGAARKIR